MARHRKRRRNPADPEHVYHEAVGMVEQAFEETAQKMTSKLYKIFGQDNDIVRDALQQGFDEFKEEWQM